jgi:hypothetical protein
MAHQRHSGNRRIPLKNSVAGILAFADRNGIASNQGILPDRTNPFRNLVIDEFAFQQHVAEIAFAIIPRSFSTVSADRRHSSKR